ncbi:YbdD/YjiX family protein [Arsenicicoccus dermatophilus]|uniref:YbdD/YjiX family protein n=1 Tax=Arsenicicoccus dermatophilus TaxID=1076331 RepID=UPI001F4C55D6|nr:YbdD/YjiX family protein [Arsenicicoccus dermatophilus]
MTTPSLASALRTARWYWRGVTGADAYERYVAHLTREHPDAPVPSEREFWRQKYADQERHPTSRCC